MTDWSAISNGATGAGTLVLALATFASVRSANRSARIAERALSVGLRPVLVPSRLEDRLEKIFWVDNHHARLAGGEVVAEIVDGNIYLAMSVRNVGNGIGVLQGWHVEARDANLSVAEPSDLALFREQTRDLYVPPGDLSFWQAGLRDEHEEHYQIARDAIQNREALIIHLLYTDHEGGQRTITRFAAFPVSEDRWLSSVSKHWFLDRQNGR
jgi:hypothetical protein